MTEQELRALVREAIARHVGGNLSGASARPTQPASLAAPVTPRGGSPLRLHPSHGLFMVTDGAAEDGPCIIEPAVPCNHCGFCKSLGH